MLLIPCPVCGVIGEETEFHYGGEAHIVRPIGEAVSEEAWETYRFIRKNPKGVHAERWLHQYGCGKWFHALRDTVNMEWKATYPITERRPDLPDAAE